MNKIKQALQLVFLSTALGTGLQGYSQYIVEPELKWADKITGPGNLNITGETLMEADGMQNIIMVSAFSGVVDFDPEGSTYEMDAGDLGGIYIWKSDSDGNFLWAKEIEYPEMSSIGFPLLLVSTLSVDKDKGDIYITGVYGDSTVDFDPGSGVYHMEPFEGWMDMMGMYAPSVFILKLNANGEFQWAKSLDIYNSTGISASVVNSNGNGIGSSMVYFTGYLQPLQDLTTSEILDLDFDPGEGTAMMTPVTPYTFSYLFALDTDGEFQWVKPLGTPTFAESSAYMRMKQMVIDEDGELYCTAVIVGGEMDVDPGTGEYIIEGDGSVSLINYSSNGEMEWIKQGERGINVADGLEVPSWVDPLSLAYNNGALYISYHFNGPVNLDNTLPFGGIATLDLDYIHEMNDKATAFSKFNLDGDFVWVKQIGDTEETNKAFMPKLSSSEEYIYLVGRYANTIDIDPGPGEHILNSGNAYIAMYDTSGSFLWGSDIVDESSPIAEVSPHNISSFYPNVYYTGDWRFNEIDADFGDGEKVLTPYDESLFSTFVSKIALNLVDTTSGIREFDWIQADLYPNPTTGNIYISLNREVKEGIITVHNILGQQVVPAKSVKGQELIVDVSKLIPGTYFIELREEAKKAVFSIIKQ